MRLAVALLFVFGWQDPNMQPGPHGKALLNYVRVFYDGEKTVPRKGSRQLTITYADLYPGTRTRGGCGWTDKTQLGSYMPIIEKDDQHETIEAPRGHVISWHCEWITPKEEVKK